MSSGLSKRSRACALLLSASMLAFAAADASAVPVTVTVAPASSTNLPAPNTTGGVGSVTMSGQTFTNQGMVGAARYTATGRDFNNDTLGSFSGMTFLRETWRRNSTTGQYSGGLLTLPDRGPNFALTGFPGNFFSDYNGRLNAWNFTFSPYTGINLAQATTSQNQMTLTPSGGFFFKDFTGNAFTGLEPGSNTFTQNGFLFGGPATGPAAGKISLDPEAVARAMDGSYWVSDEYQAGIFHFDASGKLIGYIPATPALTPRVGGVVNFTTADAVAGQTGRRLNQGLEGLTISPDGKTLWVMLQSAALQDSTLNNDALRNTTRLIGYDISGKATPTAPIAEFVMELPVFNRGNTNGTVTAGASNRTAAQSEILALNSTQFLVLSRDGNGLGNDPTSIVGNDGRPPVYKSVLLIDTAGATNINGTARQTTAAGAVTTAPGVLDTTIVPVQQVQLVNLINNTELARFGMNLSTGAGTNLTTISEKWEAMGLLPTLEENRPQDVFLFVGNDNDFQTTNGQINGGLTNGTTTITTYNSGFVNDNMFMVYRLTLPTYVDPLFYEAMVATAPVVSAALGESGSALNAGNAHAIDGQLDAARRNGTLAGASVWGSISYEDIDPLIDDAEYTAQAASGTVGIQTDLFPNIQAGAALSYEKGTADIEGGFGFDYAGTSASIYLGYVKGPWFANTSITGSLLSYDSITRPGAYGLTATGDTDGSARAFALKAGYIEEWGGFSAGPVASFRASRTSIDSFLESGAAGGNIAYAKQAATQKTWALGAEASAPVMDSILAVGTLMYNAEQGGDRQALVKLNSANAAIASQLVDVPDLADDYVSLSLGLQSRGEDAVAWRVTYEFQMGIDRSEDMTHQLVLGGALRF